MIFDLEWRLEGPLKVTDQGWQVSANGGLNRSLIRFKPSWQKQVSASVSARVLDNNAKMKEFIITMCN